MTPRSISTAGTVSRGDLVERLTEEGYAVREARALVAAVLESVTDELAAGNHVALRGFGRFEVVRRAPRLGRDLATGEVVEVPARRSVAFRPARALCRDVEEREAP